MFSVALYFYRILCILCSVPGNPEKRYKWIQAIETYQESDYYCSKFHVCELHFPSEAIKRFGGRTELLPGTVPTIFRFELIDQNNLIDENNCQIEFLEEDGAIVREQIFVET